MMNAPLAYKFVATPAMLAEINKRSVPTRFPCGPVGRSLKGSKKDEIAAKVRRADRYGFIIFLGV
jgi:hypothetical protein